LKDLLSDIGKGALIGIGISLMFMLALSHSLSFLMIVTFLIFGITVGSSITFSYISTSKFLARFKFYNHLLVRIIHAYTVSGLAFFLVSLIVTRLPWSFFPSVKIAFQASMGVGILGVMICFAFEYVAEKDERIRLEQENRELTLIEERNRIARELHDSVSQNLFGISLHLNTLHLILQEQPEKVKALISQVKEMVGEAQTEMRLMIYELQPVILQEKGFFEALETLCELFRTRYNMAITCLFSGDETKMDIQTQVALYRVIQEALHNIVKHAQATKAQVTLNITNTGISTQIKDNGQGFLREQSETKGHFGLQGMEERISALQGKLHLSSRLGEGTVITLQIPH